MASHVIVRSVDLRCLYLDRHIADKLCRETFICSDLSKLDTNGRETDYGDIAADAIAG